MIVAVLLRGFRQSCGLATVVLLLVPFIYNSRSQTIGLESLPQAIQEALLVTEFRTWPLEWVTEVDYHGFRYTLLYTHRDPESALILLITDLASGKAITIKNDTSLFPFNERAANTPPQEVRLALAEGEMSRQVEKYGSWAAYVRALRQAKLLPYLAKEQREILRKRGFEAD